MRIKIKKLQNFYFVAIMIILFYSTFVSADVIKNNSNIDFEVIDSLDKTGKAEVIIFLEDTSKISILGSKDERHVKLK